MCGLAGGQVADDLVAEALMLQTHRGPDDNGLVQHGAWTLGHVRLAIQDLTDDSAQPWAFPEVGFVGTFAGEMWNTPELRAAGTWWTSQGDTEPVMRLLQVRGIAALPGLEGMFALAWIDGQDLMLARDPFGEAPLHWARTPAGTPVYATEIAALLAMGAIPSTIQWVEPGTAMRFPPDMSWMEDPEVVHWFEAPVEEYTDEPIESVAAKLRAHLTHGVTERLTRDPGVSLACLVSGGIDSTSVVSLAVEAGLRPECYTAVYDPNSTDLVHAREVTDHLGLKLHEIQVPPPTRESLVEAVRATEMPHKAQVEIALACLPLARAIQADGHKIVLSGEGSDELWSSYGLSYHTVQRKGWFASRWDTYLGQHRKNFARTNKVFMRHGIEPRLPFLSIPLARYALTIDEQMVRWSKPGTKGTHEKAILACAMQGLLPESFAWRRKAAFQTKAGLDQAAAAALQGEDPQAFYRATFRELFGEVKP